MGLLLLLFCIAAFALIFLVLFKRKVRAGSSFAVWPFYAKRPLSKPEQILYFRLMEALPEYVVLAQVQLSRFLGVTKGHSYQSWINRINRMSADFVVCNKDFSVLAVIELDDSSHQRADRKVADDKKERALASANILITRWNVNSIPDVVAIRQEITKWKNTTVISVNSP